MLVCTPKHKLVLLVLILFSNVWINAQIQNSQWLFGSSSSLNFSTNPPTNIPGNVINSIQGSASMSDQNGNLLFYTNGATVTNRFHTTMANGTGLLGFDAGFQTCLIAKQPGNASLYYIFTVRCDNVLPGLCYSVVDMNLAAGAGSVITKNAPLFTDSLHERITGTRHCNGRDYWILVNRYRTNTYSAFLLTPSGISGPVTSTFPPSPVLFSGYGDGPMHISPTGNKLAIASYGNFIEPVRICDFDNSNGTVSNSYTLSAPFYISACAFSPDGSKIFFSGSSGVANRKLYQWDLCAGNLTAIRASRDSFSLPPALVNALQLAPNNKVYVLSSATNSLSVFNTPNGKGPLANFSFQSVPVLGFVSVGLPNMITGYQQNYAAFSFSLAPNLSCHAISFTAAPSPTPNSCMALQNYSINYTSWNFGDPASGVLNTSLNSKPTHNYSSSGTFTAMQIFHKNCGSDTVKQVILVPKPDLALSTGQVSCNIAVPATITAIGGTGPYSYTWFPSLQTGSVAALNAGTHTITVFDQGLSCSVNTLVVIAPAPAPELTISPSTTVGVCNGSTVQLTVFGSGTSYTWAPFNGNGSITGTVVSITAQSTQVYTVSTQLNACVSTRTVLLENYDLPVPSIVGKTQVCLKDSLLLFGAGGSTFEWTKNGIIGQTKNLQQLISTKNQAGNYLLKVTDQRGCSSVTFATIQVNGLPSAELSGPFEGCEPLSGNYAVSKLTAHSFATILLGGNTGRQNINHTFLTAGTYTIGTLAKDSVYGCTAEERYSVIVYQKPKADFVVQPQNPVEGSDAVLFTVLPDLTVKSQYTWYCNEPFTARGETLEHTFLNAGQYPIALLATTEQGCSDTVVKTLKVAGNWEVYVPNSFTPNDDTKNDTFYPVLINIKKIEFKIYNRWGKEIFSSKALDASWDGRYNGQDCEQGIYNWSINYTSLSGEYKQMTGQVLLLR